MFSDYVYQWLDNALDCGISEKEFWSMTMAELDRAMQSYKRRKKAEAIEQASFNYIMADLIGRSNARVHSASNKMPAISAVYPSLFDAEEIEEQRQEKLMELSALRFKHFTQTYNQKYKAGV